MIPAEVEAEIDALVAESVFPTREVAVAELVRIGLEVLKTRRTRAPPGIPPQPPDVPPRLGYQDPREDQPIEVHPWDTKWVE